LKYCLLTNDIETTSVWFNSLRDETGWKVFREGMPRLLDIYAKYEIKSTFFFTGYIARLIPDVVNMIIPHGHEIASHGLSHKKEHGFDVMTFYDQVKHLSESKKILEDISGQEVISFRAPALRVNKYTPKALIEVGYKIDSSIASQRFDFFLSFSGLKKLKWLLSPRLPYYTSQDSLFKKGNSNILEIPLNAFLIPYIGTTMRLFPNITKLLRNLAHFEYKFHRKPIVFLIHPNEFIDESAEKVNKIQRREDNYLSYLLADKLRRKLKIKNLGTAGLKLYEDQVEFFKNKQYNFVTLKNYAAQFNEKKQ
tara:strand:- start:486 stop:1412 length:927 start_codon:yes stop_codon:yes gene_type:complete